MSYVLKSTNCSAIVIDDNCGKSKFFAVANLLQKELAISFINEQKSTEQLAWDFEYKNQPLSLEFNVYSGVQILAKNNSAKSCYVGKELGDFLERKVF